MKKLLFILGFLFSSHSMACSCIQYPDDIEQAVIAKSNNVTSVVLAEAKNIKKIKIKDSWAENEQGIEGEETEFLTIQSWKGDLGDKFVTRIITQCCVCGISFEEGKKYLLYLYESDEKGYYATSACSGNLPFEQAQSEIEYLNDQQNQSKSTLRAFLSKFF